jgi:hypothetical protein
MGSNGGVNPPEAAAAVKEDLLTPTTAEAPDGTTVALPNPPDAAEAAAAPTPAAAPSDADAGAPAEKQKRKRRTKAEMAAARAAEAAGAATAASAATASPSAALSVQAAEDRARNPEAYDGPSPVDTPEGQRELAAAAAETAGHVILSDDLRLAIEHNAVADFLNKLNLARAIELVQQRLPRGVKTLEIDQP